VSADRRGGYHLAAGGQRETIASSARLDNGVNFSTMLGLQRGASELRMGKALRDGYREKVSRPRSTRSRESARSRSRNPLPPLQTDAHLIRSMSDPDSDPERVFGGTGRWSDGRGAARRQDPLRRIHRPQSPAIHLRMLETARRTGSGRRGTDAVERDGCPLRSSRSRSFRARCSRTSASWA